MGAARWGVAPAGYVAGYVAGSVTSLWKEHPPPMSPSFASVVHVLPVAAFE